MQQEAYGEVFLINKPLEWTSFDVVKKVRNTLRIKKVGHAGTLDPLATGLLIVCAGKMTKQIEGFMGQEKEYTGTFVLGATTESFDLEKPIIPVADSSSITLEQVRAAIQQLTGKNAIEFIDNLSDDSISYFNKCKEPTTKDINAVVEHLLMAHAAAFPD